ncbi:MAG: NAD(P)-dependent oxidoreductase [Lachnospirales bacterium]
MKILIERARIKESYVVEIRKQFPDFEFLYDDVKLENIKDIDILMCRRVSIDLIENAKNLKVIFLPITGVDGIPMEYLKERKIPVINTHAKAKYIAERGISLLFSAMGKVIPMDKNLRENKWANRSYTDLWYTVFNKKVAFYGYGHIGQEMARLLQPFNIEICTLSRHKGRCEVEAHKYFDNLEELADYCEVLLVSAPLNSGTKHTVNLDILKRLNGHVVNVGRGSVIEEESLFISLKEGITKTAGIDVWYTYPKEKEDVAPSIYPYNTLENVVMSPHTAWATTEDEDIFLDETFEKLANYLKENY